NYQFKVYTPPVGTATPSGLVSWYKGEGNANDALGTNNGTLQGGVTFTTGEVGQAFNLNGSSYVSVPNAPSLNITGALTIDAWVFMNTSNTNNGVVMKGPLTGSQGVYSLIIGDGGNSRVFFRLNGATFSSGEVQGATILAPGQWYHIAATYDGSTQKIY